MFQQRRPAGGSPPAASQDFPSWCGLSTLRLVSDLNVRCLRALSERACEDSPAHDTVFFHGDRAEWRRLDAKAEVAASSFPFLLLDVHFDNAAWWQSLSTPNTPSPAS